MAAGIERELLCEVGRVVVIDACSVPPWIGGAPRSFLASPVFPGPVRVGFARTPELDVVVWLVVGTCLGARELYRREIHGNVSHTVLIKEPTRRERTLRKEGVNEIAEDLGNASCIRDALVRMDSPASATGFSVSSS